MIEINGIEYTCTACNKGLFASVILPGYNLPGYNHFYCVSLDCPNFGLRVVIDD